MSPSFGPLASYPIAAPDDASPSSASVSVACPIGTSWATGSWGDAAWECLSWAGVAVVVPEPQEPGVGRRHQPFVRRVLVGVGRLTIAAPVLRGRGVLGIGARGGVAFSGPSLEGDGGLRLIGLAQTAFHAEAVGSGTVFAISRKQAEPSGRVLTGHGAVVFKAGVEGTGILTVQPDVMDTAWLDLQRQIAEEDELLLAIGVLA